MKDILLSVHPKWCEKILSGEKTIEVRKSVPKEVPFKAYIYCTKSGDRLVLKSDKYFAPSKLQTGKVIGEFICDKVVEIEVFGNVLGIDHNYTNVYKEAEEELRREESSDAD